MIDAGKLLTQHYSSAHDEWVRIADTLKGHFASLKDDAFLAERPATRFILAWMKQLGQFQTKFGNLFGRKKRPAKADDFTAAVAVCLEQFLASRGCVRRVGSEETTHRVKGAKRPDVLVYSLSGPLIVTVECKTALGWNRKGWKAEIEKRTQQMHASCPGSDLYLCVLTRSNWDYSEFEASPHCGQEWFCLSAVPVGSISDPVADSDILLPLEPMFLAILGRVRADLVNRILQLSPDQQQVILRSLEEKQ
jgi:hypothetical protein